MAEETYDPLYLRGIEQFNQRNYFECHEILEELWIGDGSPARLFYKGLIQAAMALLHFENGNLHGARKLLAGCRGYLDPYRPKYLGLDVEGFLAAISRCLAGLSGPDSGVPPRPDPALIPRIALDPAPGSARRHEPSVSNPGPVDFPG